MVANGRSIHAKRPLEWLLDDGHDVLFLGYDDTNPLSYRKRNFQFAGLPRIRGEGFLGRFVGKTTGAKAAERLRIARLRSIFRGFGPDVVHVHYIDSTAKLVTDAFKGKVALTAWGSDINRFFESNLDANAAELREDVATALRRASVVISDATSVLNRCQSLAGIPLNTSMVYLGIETQRFRDVTEEARQKWRNELGLPADAFVFGSGRAWTPLYRHERIFDAFEILTRQLRSELLYLVFKKYSPSGKQFPEIEEYITQRARASGLLERVRVIEGVQDTELPLFYSGIDCVVNWPRMDGFPVMFLESGAAGKPVATNMLPAYEDSFVEKFFNLASGQNTSDLADAIRRVAIQKKSGNQDLKQHIEQFYSASVARSKINAIYESLLR